MNAHVSQGGWPVLVLNADFRPLSYYPLSLWSWQDAIKAVFLDRVNIVEHYDRAVHSPSFEIQLPSVVSLKSFVKPTTHPAFTRFNVFLRDRFVCQYCHAHDDLTFDHIIPRSKGGQTTWENVVAACSPCNLRKGDRLPREVEMWPRQHFGNRSTVPQNFGFFVTSTQNVSGRARDKAESKEQNTKIGERIKERKLSLLLFLLYPFLVTHFAFSLSSLFSFDFCLLLVADFR